MPIHPGLTTLKGGKTYTPKQAADLMVKIAKAIAKAGKSAEAAKIIDQIEKLLAKL